MRLLQITLYPPTPICFASGKVNPLPSIRTSVCRQRSGYHPFEVLAWKNPLNAPEVAILMSRRLLFRASMTGNYLNWMVILMINVFHPFTIVICSFERCGRLLTYVFLCLMSHLFIWMSNLGLCCLLVPQLRIWRCAGGHNGRQQQAFQYSWVTSNLKGFGDCSTCVAS